MSLKKQLAETKAQSGQVIPQNARKIMDAELDRLVKAGLAQQAPKKGEPLPAFTLPNQSGIPKSLGELLEKGPTVIVFYRGGWCPYCNLELRAYQEVLGEIRKRGATLVAISPELPDSSLSTSERNDLAYEVLSDQDSRYAHEIGIAFTLSDELREVYGKFGLELEKHNGPGRFTLPLPATFVVDTDGTIAYAFVDPDYTVRAEPADVLDALDQLER
ncbi:peroxiredoxin-like family protein [Pseudodesulfovibrio thermohalotolerans]|uniref:peroxiredoxin-like family protein n=1 Tax=Pseudodesulfovibrio thermohalotolerans TaxID=2880651 RepID=UPI002441C8A7|nr:peroxiredoxin-like family protein [Pseudodesulfovibrio thermohalotolerans]WFS63874.1 peroxiredoxin-like family protein [Pseudodesulfovibrio thermohalotolerans]